MGWKSVKEHYRIGHIVHVSDGKLYIGSPYVNDLVVVTPDGLIEKSWDRLSGDLARYVSEITADPALFARLFAQEDTFLASMTVYTFHDGDILEHACEEPGWPNITHDGKVMYENLFFVDRTKAVAAARKNASAGIRLYEERIVELRETLASVEESLRAQKAALAKLDVE